MDAAREWLDANIQASFEAFQDGDTGGRGIRPRRAAAVDPVESLRYE